MSKHSLQSAQVRAIKAGGNGHVRVDFRPVFTCVFWICLGWRHKASQVHTNPFHVWPGPGDDPPTWSHPSRTRRQITVLKDTLRDAQTDEQMGPGKNLVPPFIPHLQSISLIRSLFQFCDAWKFVKRSGGFGWLHMWKLKMIFKNAFMSSRISSLSSRLTAYPWSKNLPYCACNFPCHGFL